MEAIQKDTRFFSQQTFFYLTVYSAQEVQTKYLTVKYWSKMEVKLTTVRQKINGSSTE